MCPTEWSSSEPSVWITINSIKPQASGGSVPGIATQTIQVISLLSYFVRLKSQAKSVEIKILLKPPHSAPFGIPANVALKKADAM
jgi:hypothetical protein